jgi:hypothetical protein
VARKVAKKLFIDKDKRAGQREGRAFIPGARQPKHRRIK